MNTYIIEYDAQGYGEYLKKQEIEAPSMWEALQSFLKDHPEEKEENQELCVFKVTR